MKRVFGRIEVIFDISYLLFVLLLAGGDSFHLFPRIALIRTGKEKELAKALGIGKQITSITMTVFYLFLWHIGLLLFSPRNITGWTYLIYILAAIRIFICFLPQNDWQARHTPLKWGIARNIPFVLQGFLVASLFFIERNSHSCLNLMWLAIFLSFAFYLPVVLWSKKNPKIGMLMLPKTTSYLWMIGMCLTL